MKEDESYVVIKEGYKVCYAHMGESWLLACMGLDLHA